MTIEPITREEKLMAKASGEDLPEIKPITRREMFLAKAGGSDIETPTPITREEMFLQKIAENGGGSTGGGTEVKTCNVTIRGIAENLWLGEILVMEYIYTKYKDGKFEVVQEQSDVGEIFGGREFEVTFENVVCGTVLYFRAMSGGNNDIAITFDECLTIIEGFFDEEVGAYVGGCRGFIISPDANDCTVTINAI